MHSDPTHDEAFRRAVVRAAEAMDEPPYAGERLHQAVDIVLSGSVMQNGNGTATVRSGSHTYQIDPQEGCTCADSRNRSKHCKHTIAVELLRRARTNMNEPDNDSEAPFLPDVMKTVPQQTDWQCAQAPSSCTLKWQLAGIELLLTLRAATDAELFARIKRILPKIQEKVSYNGNGQPPDIPQCSIHNVPMKRYTKGDQTWYSHKAADGSWCRGK